MSQPDLQQLPELPVDDAGPVFKAPWEAKAFAIALQLQQQGLFTWNEWAETLGATLAAARDAGEPDTGENYYEYWLACLETLVKAKGLATAKVLAEQKQKAHEAQQALHAHTHS